MWRALRINELLRSDTSVTVDHMRRWQTDPGSVRADQVRSVFHRRGRYAAPRVASLPRRCAPPRTILRAWDRRYTFDNEAAVLFERAMTILSYRTWDELEVKGERVATPSSAVLAELLAQPRNAWWDDRRTPGSAKIAMRFSPASLDSAYRSVVAQYGTQDKGGWRWDRIRFENIYHLLRLPAFSALGHSGARRHRNADAVVRCGNSRAELANGRRAWP